MKTLPPMSAPHFAHGYYATPRGRKLTEFASPSENICVSQSGEAFVRPGKDDTGWDLNNANHAYESLYIQEYNVTFLVSDNKVQYIDHEFSNTVYDTGITLTEQGTLSSYNGCVYVTNTVTTGNVYRISLTRAQSAISSGATSVTIEEGTIYRFATGSGNVRINGTNEAFIRPTNGNVTGAANNGSGLVRITTSAAHNMVTGSRVTIASVGGTTEANGTWTITKIDSTHFDLQSSTFSNVYTAGGTWTYISQDQIVLSSGASQSYANNVLIIGVNTSEVSLVPRGKKIVFWEGTANTFGVKNSTSQVSKRTWHYGDSVDAGDWKTIESFTTGLSGTQTVGESGVIKNMLPVLDYFYVFTDHETYYTSVSGVNLTSGARPPHLFTPKYGTVNHKSAIDLNGRIAWIAHNKRIMRSKPSDVAANPSLVADESFDAPVRYILDKMDDDQSQALAFFYAKANIAIYQIKVDGQFMILVYDNNPIFTDTGVVEGRWWAPFTGWAFSSLFEAKGVLYGTDISDDTIYELLTGQTDDGGDISATFATGIYEIDKGRSLADWGDFECSGGITQNTTCIFTPFVNEADGVSKSFDATNLDFTSAESIGDISVGDMVLGGNSSDAEYAHFDKSIKISPAKGRSFQGVISTEGDGASFKISSWKLPLVKFYQKSLVTRI